MKIERRDFLKATAALTCAGLAVPAVVRAGAPASSSNEKIEKARQAAIDLLQPTPQQLEHGLELHAASMVFESYGFSPRSAIDGDALRKAVESNATTLELQDLREDMSMTRCVTSPAERAEYLEAWRASGVTCIFQNAGEECQSPLRMLKRLARYTYVTDHLRDVLFKAVGPDDVVAAKKAGKHCLYLSGNAVPITQEWISLEDELQQIRVFFELGMRMMHMTYNRRNMLGDGCAEPANGGLSDFGRAAVAEMNRVGVIPDVAHSGWQTSLETAQVSQKPILASHTACDALNHHCRCKPDNVIRAICDKDGLVGICAIPTFLGGTADLRAMLDHIVYVAKRYGADHVAIGTDVGYQSRNAEAEQKKAPRQTPARPRWENFWPPSPSRIVDHQASMAWTNWPMFTVGMVQRGLSDSAIQKILGGNVLRVARATLV